jgi:hypothetical protein
VHCAKDSAVCADHHPVTDSLPDLHDSWTTGTGLGPGSATYEQQLKTENAAFGTSCVSEPVRPLSRKLFL